MKKLALALVCLVSVAFFASCQKEAGIPSINFVAGEGYTSTDVTVDTSSLVKIGIQASSNPTTLEPLTKLYIQILNQDGERVGDTLIENINQNQYYCEFADKYPVGAWTIIATVHNSKDMTNECRIEITSIITDTPLIASTFTWNRHGGEQATGLEQFGLEWTSNGKEDFAKITPLEGVTLYEFNAEDWENINTVNQKNILFSLAMESGNEITLFNKVSAWTTHDYNYVIGTVMPDGTTHLMHITKGEVSTFKGTDITITGEAK